MIVEVERERGGDANEYQVTIHINSSHRRKTRGSSHTRETVVSCWGPEPRDGRRATGSGVGRRRGEEAQETPRRVVDAMRETGETRARGEK